MEIWTALILMVVMFIVFSLISYYGAKITALASFIFAAFMSFIILNVSYPISQIANENATVYTYIYITLQLLVVTIIVLYVVYTTLSTVRTK